MAERRAYTSLLRDEQQELTRSRIVAAAADLVRQGRIHSFTIGDVAARAGVSYGSVYRHFATRERLLEELYESFQHVPGSPSVPDSLEDVPRSLDALLAHFEEVADVALGGAVAMTAMGVVPQTQREHDDAVGQLVAAANPDLPPDEVRARAAVLRLLGGSLGWAILRQRFELDAEATSSALTWALNALVRDV